MAKVKPLAPNIEKSVNHILNASGEVGQLYRADIHRSVVTRVIVDSLIEEGVVKEGDERVEVSQCIYKAMAMESSLLEHSNFKQSRLAKNGLIPEAVNKPTGTGLVI